MGPTHERTWRGAWVWGGAVLAGVVGVMACAWPTLGADAQPRPPGKQDRPGLLARMTAFQTDVPAHPFDIVLVRPTQNSVTVSVVAYGECEGYVEYSGWTDAAPSRTPRQRLAAGEPGLFVLDGLKPDSAYSYRWMSRPAITGEAGKAGEYAPSERYSFHTPRGTGSAFTFTVVADSHLDSNMTPAVYERTLEHALSGGPDFHMDLGDTFMTDKRGRDFKAAQPQYVAQRYYFGKLCHSAPLFMVLGNHDGEWGYAKGGEEGMAAWSFAERTRLFPPPEIAGGAACMYSGRTVLSKGQGSNYYTFAWGDARVIVLDPFWFTGEKMRGPGGRGGQEERPAEESDTTLTDQGWTLTLGREQYDWLARTLEASTSGHTFVFIHHLVGGRGRSSRGGVESASFFEWGGKNADGSDGFAAHRPGWAMPIHRLLVEHHVSAVFHGHDHLYVHNQLDGVTYQCVPQPGNVNGGTRSAGEYGYTGGEILGSPGYLRVSVDKSATRVDYLRMRGGGGERRGDERSAMGVWEVAASYEVGARELPRR